MKTAFEILGVSKDVEDEMVKSAYLRKVKQYPPEQASVQFQHIREAYEAIKDARSRIKYQLFHQPESDFDKLLERAFETDSITAVDGDCFTKLFQSGAEDRLVKGT